MNEIAVKPQGLPGAPEARSLARELAAAFRDRVNRYKHEQGLSTEEAVAKADEPCSLSRAWKIQDCAPEELTWADLQELAGETGNRAAAPREGGGGARGGGLLAAAALEGRDSTPWRRAVFLAVRAELAEGWQPRNAVERQLIDQMAQAQAALFFWHERLAAWASDGVDDVAE